MALIYAVALPEHHTEPRWMAYRKLNQENDLELFGEMPWDSDTIVLPAHRGNRLGLLAKAANLIQVRHALGAQGSIVTWNAAENQHMLAVNEALGFRQILLEGAFQKHTN